jgi:hypothetical protein
MQGPSEPYRPQPSPREATEQVMQSTLNNVPELRQTDPQFAALKNALSNRTVSAQFGQAGRTVAAAIGVGSCTRHFYNRTDSFWAIALINSGTCHVDGDADPAKPACMIPPGQVATLNYSNPGNNGVTNAGVAIAAADGHGRRGNYSEYFRLRAVGCYIEHRGNTGAANLNDPADGDVTARW